MGKKQPDHINVIDFDHTIYSGDCSIDFYFFCVRTKPTILRYAPSQIWHTMLFLCRVEERTVFKSKFFSFLKSIPNTEKLVDAFWDKNMHKIKKWYTDRTHDNDVIVSASPEFLVYPIRQLLDVRDVFATKVNPKTGDLIGKNCRGEEKVRRIHEAYSDIQYHQAYSDSLADMPILSLAAEPYIVIGNKITDLSEYVSINRAKRVLLDIRYGKLW